MPEPPGIQACVHVEYANESDACRWPGAPEPAAPQPWEAQQVPRQAGVQLTICSGQGQVSAGVLQFPTR